MPGETSERNDHEYGETMHVFRGRQRDILPLCLPAPCSNDGYCACMRAPTAPNLRAAATLTDDAFPYKFHQIHILTSIMRTTINIEDDAFAAASTYARARALKLGQAVSELILRGSAEKLPIRQKGGVWVFDLPRDTPRVTARQVRRMLDESV